MFLSRTDETRRRQTPPSTTIRHSRWTLAFLIHLLLTPTDLCLAQRSPVTLSRGPSTGIITQEIPNLLLTEHRIISQLVYIDLDIESTLNKQIPITDVHDSEVLAWYETHIARTKDTIKDILSQAAKTIIKQQPPSTRSKRAIGAVVMGVMALMTIVGTVVGSTMSAANGVSVKAVQKKNEELQAAIKEIQASLESQRNANLHLVQVVKDTIVVTGLQTERLERAAKLHEQTFRARFLFYSVVEPILFFTNNYLRQLEIDVNNLLRAHIPLYFVDVHLVRMALSSLHGPDLDLTQIGIAFEAGTAIPMYIDVDRMHISFLLNIPLVKPEKVYQLKKILNVGTWQGDTKVKINSPTYIAYQNSSNMYLIPHLQSCQTFKDLNYLCPGNPFTPVKGGFLCGLEDSPSDSTLCDITVSRPTDIVTEAVLIGNLWLVSTNAPNMTITYTKHATFTIKPITHSTFTTVVPKDVIISIGPETLFYVSTEKLEGEMELVNTFKPFSIPPNPDLDFLLDKKPSHSLQLLLTPDNVSISDFKFSTEDTAHMLSPEYWKNLSQIIWGAAVSLWLVLITILIAIHNKFILQVVKIVRQRQQELQLLEMQSNIV